MKWITVGKIGRRIVFLTFGHGWLDYHKAHG